ncbi:MAG: hypothetical protein C5B47_05580 [Verrucomicrobia bacterium]|nr:MAG: hypothetical protein C5B47_05580 [Verrucomicrobiota bacterium]
MISIQKDFRQESIILRQDWMRKRETMEGILHQLDVLISQAASANEIEQIKAKAALIKKTYAKHLEEQERTLRSLEKNGCLLDREQKIKMAYQKVYVMLQWVHCITSGIFSITEAIKLNAQDLFGQQIPLEIPLDDENSDVFHDALFLESVLTDWQMAAARIIERELLVPRRIGSICFLSNQNGLLGMKLSFMLRVGLIEPNRNRATLCAELKNAWSLWHANFRLLITTGSFSSAELVARYRDIFDALFLDYEILKAWGREWTVGYAEVLSDLEPAFPFLILLLTDKQVESHREILQHMNVELHPLYSKDRTLLSEDVSTLLIARRKSRYILHYASEPWDMMVKDFAWHRSQSLKEPKSGLVNHEFPNPFHLSEKILLSSEFTVRATNISMDANTMPATWASRREVSCWRKFGEQIPEIPRLFSDETSDKEWKIVLFLGKGNWTFARKLQLPAILNLTRNLLGLISWFRQRSLFLNNIRTDTFAVDGSSIRLLSLERLSTCETEDTLSSLLWFWHDVGDPAPPLRPWPIEFFSDENLSKIPEPLQELAQAASCASGLDAFLENLPIY